MTKNFFVGLGITDCSARSPEIEKLSLEIPDPAKLPNALWRRVTEIATPIAATIMEKTIKTILLQIGTP